MSEHIEFLLTVAATSFVALAGLAVIYRFRR